MRKLRSWPVFGRIVDVAIPLAILVAGILEASLARHSEFFPGPLWAHVLLMTAGAAPLLFRRRFPSAVVIAVTGATVAYSVAVYDLSGQPPIEPFLSMLVAYYSAAVYSRGANDDLITAVSAVAFLAEEVGALTAGRAPGDILPAILFVAVLWGLGRVVRSRHHLVIQLENRNLLLESQRAAEAKVAVDRERSRIARELHDVIAHSLSVMVVQASAERRVLPRDAESTRSVFLSIEQAGREALAELRRLLGIIRKEEGPAPLTPQPGLSQIDALVGSARTAGLKVDVETEGTKRTIPSSIDLSAYRIIQEALTNVIKHAHASRIDIRICYLDHDIELEVNDDGDGPKNGPASGFGLVGIGERISLYGGSLEVGRSATGGFRLVTRLPAVSAE